MKRTYCMLGTIFLLVAPLVGSQLPVSRASAAANSYYVAKSGSNSNPGTLSQPWLTIQRAANTVGPGDTVYVRGGVYSEYVYIGTSGSYTGKSGTSGSPITYRAYPGESPIIDGSGLGNPGWRGLVTIYNLSYINISGFEIRNTPQKGVLIFGRSSYVTLSNLEIHGMTMGGVYAETTTNLLIDSCEVYDTNTVIESDEQVSLITCSNFEIRYSSFHNSGKNALDFKEGSSNGLVHHNEIYGTNDTTTGIYLDANGQAQDNFKIYANKIHDCRGPGIVLGSETSPYPAITNVDIFNNLIYNNNTGFAVWANPFTRNFRIINNTFYGNNAAIGVYGTGWAAGVNSNCIIRNNIIMTAGGYLIGYEGYATGGAITIDRNLYYDTTGAYRREPSSMLGSNYIQANPQLSSAGSNFSLTSGSPAKDAGSSASAPSTDYVGAARPQGAGYDIGAYEYGVQASLSVTTGAASGIAASGAVLNGSLPNLGTSAEAAVSFDWGTNTGYTGGSVSGSPSLISVAPASFSAILGSLSPGTVYHYRAKAVGATTVYGGDQQFTTLTPPPALTVTTAALPNATVGVAYSQTLTATGGTTLYAWTVASGTLPSGLSLGSAGLISGTPTAAGGPTSLTFRVTDSVGVTATKSLPITVDSGLPVITTGVLPNGTVGVAYSQTLTATGGITPYAWSVASGTLPGGLSLSTAGVISGTPASAGGPTAATFRVADARGLTASKALAITIVSPSNLAPVLAAIGDKSVAAGQLLQFSVSATDPNGGVLGYSASNLPAGAVFDSPSGVFRWTPTSGQAGSHPGVRFQVSDGSLTDSEDITITVTAPNVTAPPPTPAPAGGGSSAGAATGFSPSLGGVAGPAGVGITNLAIFTGDGGIFNIDGSAASADGLARLSFAKGVKAQNRDGIGLHSVSIAPLAEAHPSTPGSRVLGETYQFGPDGARFSPSITLTLELDRDTLPDDVALASLRIGLWDGKAWLVLDSVVDPGAMTISAEVSHFSTYGVIDIGYVAPVPAAVPDDAAPPVPSSGTPVSAAGPPAAEPAPLPSEASPPATVGAAGAGDNPPAAAVPAFRLSLLAVSIAVAVVLIALTGTLVAVRRRKLLITARRSDAVKTGVVERPETTHRSPAGDEPPRGGEPAGDGAVAGTVPDIQRPVTVQYQDGPGRSTTSIVEDVKSQGESEEHLVDMVVTRLGQLGRLSFGEPGPTDARR